MLEVQYVFHTPTKPKQLVILGDIIQELQCILSGEVTTFPDFFLLTHSRGHKKKDIYTVHVNRKNVTKIKRTAFACSPALFWGWLQ